MTTRTVLTLVRHGETRANLDGVWHGSTDTPLTERGRVQAQRVAAHLAREHADAAAVYASHLERARRTAEAIAEALGLPVRVECDLGEYRLGEWEGKSFRELQRDHRLWEHMKTDPDFAPHGGESPRQVTERFSDALHRIAGAHRGSRVIVVTHAGALSMGLAHILDGSYTEWGRVMENCAVSELVPEPPPELLSFNHTAHLEGL